MDEKIYLRSDLANECRARCMDEKNGISGVSFSEKNEDGIIISTLSVEDERGEKLLRKPRGNYITVGFDKSIFIDDERKEELVLILSREISSLMKTLCPDALRSVLVAGIGNKALTCDAVGPLTAESITVTRPLALHEPTIFSKLSRLVSSYVCPGVQGETGIESSLLIKKATDIVCPDLVIAIDALAAHSPDRLLQTVQLCDTGIAPGSGVGNKRPAINKDFLGVPVIAIGIPTVVDSCVLVLTSLEKAGISNDLFPAELLEALKSSDNFFVSPKDCDLTVRELSIVISSSLDLAFSSIKS